MEEHGWQIVHALAKRYHRGKLSELEPYLSEADQQAFAAGEEGAPQFPTIATSAEAILASLHPSWLLAPIETAPPPLRSALLTALPESSAKDLAQLLGEELPPHRPSATVRTFILELFYRLYAKQICVIPSVSQPGALALLLDLSTKKIREIITMLGVWDLAEDARRIIETKRLKAIFCCLNPSEQAFLKSCLQSRDRLNVPALGLERWQGECVELRRLLAKRGLSRLGKGLSGHPTETIKRLCRKLDTSYAKDLITRTQRKEIPGVTPVAVQQVLQAVKFLERSWSEEP